MVNTVIYLVRHGQTGWNREGRTQGVQPNPLNRYGLCQMRALREKIKHWPIDVIVSSPLRRALQSAQILARGRQIHVINDLHERWAGVYEGLTRPELFQKFPDIQQQWDRDGIDHQPPGNGETWRQAYTRALNTLNKIIMAYSGKRILVVTHGGIIRSILNLTFKRKPESVLEMRNPRNSELVRLIHNGRDYHAYYPDPLKTKVA